MMGSGAEAIGSGGALGTGSGAAGSTSPLSAFFSPGGTGGNALNAVKSVGSNMLSDATPKSTTDYLKLGQTASSMMGGGQRPAPMPPPPMMRPGGSAIPMGDPQANMGRIIPPGGGRMGGGGIDPRTLAILAKLMGRR
jgi:hypothetical protein